MWDCPATLTVDGMESLRMVLSSNPMPWTLDVGPTGNASSLKPCPCFQGCSASLCDEPVSLRFAGADMLLQALRNLTPPATGRWIPCGGRCVLTLCVPCNCSTSLSWWRWITV